MKLYTSTLWRSPPFIVGLIFGYYMEKFETNKEFFSKKTQLILWFVTVIWIFTPFLGLTRTHFEENSYHFSLITVYGKPVWSVGVAWIITACHFGKFEIAQKFLSKSFWRPLTKLGLSIFLMQPIVVLIFYDVFLTKKFTDFSDMNLVIELTSICSYYF
jgi:hypothetical protein